MSKIEKLYDISLTGEKEVVTSMNLVNDSFNRAKKTFLELKRETGKKIPLIVDPSSLAQEKKALEDAEKALINETRKKVEARQEAQALIAARQREKNEAQKLNAENKKLAESYNETDKALKEARQKSKELALESTNLRNQKKQEQIENQKTKQSNNVLANSYDAILVKVRELRNQQKSNLDILNIDEAELQRANAEIRELQDRLNAFNRSLTSDGTNVGEYTRGILNAFKQAGLDDLISSNIDKAKNKVNELDNRFEELTREINNLRASGVTSFETLEREIIENRNEAQKYRDQLQNIRRDLQGIENSGKQMSDSLKKHFGNIKQEAVGLLLSYISIQQAIQTVIDLKNRAVDFDSAGSALASISGDLNEYETNTRFLNSLVEKYNANLLGLTTSYKSFYAASTQSNISQKETRNIYEAVIEAGSVLKLKQDDINGALIAFGQIASKGKVQAEELRGQIGERIPGAFGIAARAMGVTTSELDKMMADGKLLANDFLPKFAAELRKTFSAGGQEITGLQASFNKWENLLNRIASNQKFVKFIGLMVDGLLLTAQTINAIPWQMWVTFVYLLTAAYWQNIVALGAKGIALTKNIALTGLISALNATATTIEVGQAAATWLLITAKRVLNTTLITLGVSTTSLNSIWIALNATFLATPIGWIVAGIALIGASVMAYSEYVDEAKDKVKQLSEAQKKQLIANRNNVEMEERANKATSEQISKSQVYLSIAKNKNNADSTRKKALEDLIALNPTYLNQLNLENIETAKGVQILEAYKQQIIEVAKAKAAQSMLEEKQKRIIENEFKQEQLKRDMNNRYGEDAQKKQSGWQKTKIRVQDGLKTVGNWVGIGDGDVVKQFETVKEQIKQDKEDVEMLAKKVAGYYESGILKDILAGPGVVSDKKGDKNKPAKNVDPTKIVDDERDRLMAIEKQKRATDEIDESTYQKRILAIQKAAIDKKLTIIKGANVEEKKTIEELKAERITLENETNKTLYDLRQKAIENEFEQKKFNLENDLKTATVNPEMNEVDKEMVEQKYYEDLLVLQTNFNNDMDILEKEYKQTSVSNADERKNELLKIEQDLNKNTYELSKARFEQSKKDIERLRDNVKFENELKFQKDRLSVLSNKKTNEKTKELELDKLYLSMSLDNIKQEIDANNKMILIYTLRYGQAAVLMEEYQALIAANATLNADAAEIQNKLGKLSGKSKGERIGAPSDSNSQEKIKNEILEGFGLDDDEYGALVGHAIAQSFDLATTAMNNYFAAEEKRIQKAKELAFERIDLEKKQRLAQAQSEDERNAIEKQATQKKKQAEKEAGARLKKIKRNEAKIAFAMELANIWASVYQLGPIAGPIMGGVLSALATAKFAMTMSNINKTEYGRGGLLKNGNYHSENNGMPIMNPKTGEVEAFIEKDEAIVNRHALSDNNIYTVTGSPKQIVSRINSLGGGVDFMGGATMKRFARGGSFMGSNVNPPVFSDYNNSMNSKVDMSEINARMEAIEKTNQETSNLLNREVKRPVVVSSREMTNQQKKDSTSTIADL